MNFERTLRWKSLLYKLQAENLVHQSNRIPIAAFRVRLAPILRATANSRDIGYSRSRDRLSRHPRTRISRKGLNGKPTILTLLGFKQKQLS